MGLKKQVIIALIVLAFCLFVPIVNATSNRIIEMLDEVITGMQTDYEQLEGMKSQISFIVNQFDIYRIDDTNHGVCNNVRSVKIEPLLPSFQLLCGLPNATC